MTAEPRKPIASQNTDKRREKRAGEIKNFVLRYLIFSTIKGLIIKYKNNMLSGCGDNIAHEKFQNIEIRLPKINPANSCGMARLSSVLGATFAGSCAIPNKSKGRVKNG